MSDPYSYPGFSMGISPLSFLFCGGGEQSTQGRPSSRDTSYPKEVSLDDLRKDTEDEEISHDVYCKKGGLYIYICNYIYTYILYIYIYI